MTPMSISILEDDADAEEDGEIFFAALGASVGADVGEVDGGGEGPHWLD